MFILFEMTKGEQSFYHSYFEAVCPLDELACWWDSHNDISNFDDPVLRADLKNSKKEHEDDWANVQKLTTLYEDDYF